MVAIDLVVVEQREFCDFLLWCFASRAIAEEFAAEFGQFHFHEAGLLALAGSAKVDAVKYNLVDAIVS